MSILGNTTGGIASERRRARSALVLVAVLAVASSLLIGGARPAAAADDFRYLVQMHHKTFIPVAGDYAAALDYMGRNSAEGTVHLLVQMNEIPASAARVSLADRGLVLQGYLPERVWYALASTSLGASDLAALGVRWAAPLTIDEKVSQRVLAGDYGPWTDYTAGRRIYAVQFHDDVARSDAERTVSSYSSELGGWIESIRTQIAALTPPQIEDLARNDQVKYVDMLPPVLSAVNDGIRTSIGVNTVQTAPYNLTGVGSNVLVYDAGMVDRNHPDFGSPTRVTWGENGSNAQHSTHVGGTVGGDGHNSSGTYKGMAPATAITSYYYPGCSPYCLYNSPADIEANFDGGFHDHGANFATASLGSNIAPNGYPCSWEGDYELTAQLLDAISHGSLGLPFMSLWAAGNERAYGNCGTSYNTTGVPATAKNNIVIGATNSNDHSMTYFSSWGPVDDGRTRPDVCAPGCQTGGDGGITSTLPGGSYGVMCGTSMATPATAGVVADLLQQWRQTFGLPLRPEPSMIKALLINTAFDYGNVGPDFQFGYGEIRPVELMDHLRNHYLSKQTAIDNGEEIIYNVAVPAGQAVLKATLAWDDVQGQVAAQRELVNDLDLTLESPSGTITQPWILTPSSPSTPATRGVDRLNPSEQVLVNNPEAGTWKVHVMAYQVPQGPQTFSVVANAPLGQDQTDVPESAPARSLETASSPNPFSPRTTIRFRTNGTAPVSLFVFDSGGRRVRTLLEGQQREAGTQFVTWDGRDDRGQALPGGAYFYQVVNGDRSEGKKLLLVK